MREMDNLLASSVERASALCVQDYGFNPWSCHTKKKQKYKTQWITSRVRCQDR